MTRKPSDHDVSNTATQKRQKTLLKTRTNGNIKPPSTQNSNFPPLSQLESSDKGACDSTSLLTVRSDAGPYGGRKVNNFDLSGPESISVPTSTPPTLKQKTSKQLGLRIASAVVALVPLSLLILAGNLNPAERGLGTHQQLGLPPCSLRVLAGIRCPACGMTTSWSYFARGNWLASVNTNAGGFLLALLCIATTVPATQVVRCGRLPSPRIQMWLTMGGAAVLTVTLVDWIIRLQH